MIRSYVILLLLFVNFHDGLHFPRLRGKWKTLKAPEVSVSPFSDKSAPSSLSTIKVDNKVERFVIHRLSKAFSILVYDKSKVDALVHGNMKFEHFVDLTKVFLRQHPMDDIPNQVVSLLIAIVPSSIRRVFSSLAKFNTKLVCELSSVGMNMGFLKWLVGPTERFAVTVPKADGTEEQWHSGVKLTKCRYLEASGCKSACLYMCKAPTEQFFNQEIGLPMYMKPNFEDQSCELRFGQSPPPMEEDPAYSEKCYKSCSLLSATKKTMNNNSNSSAI